MAKEAALEAPNDRSLSPEIRNNNYASLLSFYFSFDQKKRSKHRVTKKRSKDGSNSIVLRIEIDEEENKNRNRRAENS